MNIKYILLTFAQVGKCTSSISNLDLLLCLFQVMKSDALVHSRF